MTLIHEIASYTPKESWLNINQACLKKHHPQLWQKINIQQIKRSTLSLSEPDLDSRAQVQKNLFQLGSLPKILVLLGLGQGNLLQELLAQDLSELYKVVIIEKEEAHFKKLMDSVCMTQAFKDSRFHFFIGHSPQEFKHIFYDLLRPSKSLYYYKNLVLIPDQLEVQHVPFKQYYFEVAQFLQEGLMFRLKTAKSDPQDNLLGLINTLKNSSGYAASPSIDELHNQFTDVPGIVLASGPSLSQALPYLKGLNEKAILAGVSSNAELLLQHAIDPHFISVVERMPAHSNLIRNLNPSTKTRLLTLPLVDPLSFNAFGDQRVTLLRELELYKWFPSTHKRHYFGSSSALLSYYLLQWMGCNPIILIGQDLAYHPQDQKTHAPGADKPRGSIIDLNQYKKISVPSNNGGSILTCELWLKFKNTYERLIAQSTVPCINAIPSDMGAKIEGTRHYEIKEALEYFVTQTPKEPLGERLNRLLKPAEQKDWIQNKLSKQINHSMEIILHIKDQAQKIKEHISSIQPTDQELKLGLNAYQALFEGSSAARLLHDIIHPLDLDLMASYFSLGSSPQNREQKKNLLLSGLDNILSWAPQIYQTLQINQPGASA